MPWPNSPLWHDLAELVAKSPDASVRALLQKYDCPIPYHAVRTRFLGAIASPIDTVSPIATSKGDRATEPFRFMELSLPNNTEGLATRALVRREEIDGFVDGLFGPEERVDLPESGYRALGELGEIRAMLGGVYELATRLGEQEVEDAGDLIENVGRMSRIAEHELKQMH